MTMLMITSMRTSRTHILSGAWKLIPMDHLFLSVYRALLMLLSRCCLAWSHSPDLFQHPLQGIWDGYYCTSANTFSLVQYWKSWRKLALPWTKLSHDGGRQSSCCWHNVTTIYEKQLYLYLGHCYASLPSQYGSWHRPLQPGWSVLRWSRDWQQLALPRESLLVQSKRLQRQRVVELKFISSLCYLLCEKNFTRMFCWKWSIIQRVSSLSLWDDDLLYVINGTFAYASIISRLLVVSIWTVLVILVAKIR